MLQYFYLLLFILHPITGVPLEQRVVKTEAESCEVAIERATKHFAENVLIYPACIPQEMVEGETSQD